MCGCLRLSQNMTMSCWEEMGRASRSSDPVQCSIIKLSDNFILLLVTNQNIPSILAKKSFHSELQFARWLKKIHKELKAPVKKKWSTSSAQAKGPQSLAILLLKSKLICLTPFSCKLSGSLMAEYSSLVKSRAIMFAVLSLLSFVNSYLSLPNWIGHWWVPDFMVFHLGSWDR